MPDITLRNNIVYAASTGAVICRTPKTSYKEVIDDVEFDRHCVLVRNVDEFVYYFGDPYINPTEYQDAILALDLVKHNVQMCVSSVDEMKHNDDGFDIPYNGYTEFYFLDDNKYRTVGYKLKSELKFCQPIIQSEYKLNTLTVYASLFLLDRTIIRTDVSTSGIDGFDPSHGNINVLDPTRLYKTYVFYFNVNESKDSDIVDALAAVGLTIKLLNTSKDTSFIEELCSRSSLVVSNDQSKYPEYKKNSHGDLVPTGKTNLDYEYDLHTDNYCYDFSSDDKIIAAYTNAIDLMRDMLPQPLFICLSKMYRSLTIMSDDRSYIVRESMGDLDPYNYSVVQNILLNKFDPNCTTFDSSTLREVHKDGSHSYLFISTPDLPVAAVRRWLSCSDEFSNIIDHNDQYNCDMYYGYVIESISSSLYYQQLHRVLLPASTVSMYNILLSNSDSAYIPNSIAGLNIANTNVKVHLLESSAKKLANNRCNSAVLFDTGYPSIYGDRSLSLLPNLRYSHIARNFILIRRLISEYLETRKFIINTTYSIDICVNYIESQILNQFKILGVLLDHSISTSTSDRYVYITVTLYFTQMAESLKLNFTI